MMELEKYFQKNDDAFYINDYGEKKISRST